MDAQIRAKHEKFLYPIVRVVAPSSSGGGNGGSGIVVYSAPVTPKAKEFETYILTNHHVISPLIDVQEKWHPTVGRDIKVEKRSEGMVEFFGYENLSRITDAMTKRADLMAWDDQKDLALLRLRATQKVEFVAPIIKPSDVEKKLFIFTPVYTVGCGLGVPPLVTEGHIGGFDFTIDNYPYTLTTAPGIYGNSGGALLSQETGEVIGVTARIAVAFAGFSADAITHMMWSVSPKTIYQFLEEQVFDFIVDPSVTSKQCEKKRDDMKKKAFEALIGGAPTSPEGVLKAESEYGDENDG